MIDNYETTLKFIVYAGMFVCLFAKYNDNCSSQSIRISPADYPVLFFGNSIKMRSLQTVNIRYRYI